MIAAASTRGRRARKKICASTLSANGVVRLKTWSSEILVLPTSGASRMAPAATAPKPMIVAHSRRRRSVCAGNRDHRDMTGARVVADLGVDVVGGADARRG